MIDDLTVTYLDHVRLLDVLTRSVAAVYVDRDLDRQNPHSVHDRQVDALLAAVDRIRAAVNKGVEAGPIHFTRRREHDADEDAGNDADTLELSPTLDIMSDLKDIDVVIADDRCLGKLPTWTDGSGNNAVCSSTLSVLAFLRSKKLIDDEGYWRARDKLRASGYYAMPVELEELQYHLTAAPIVDHKLRETPELRSIRESMDIAQVNRCYLPAEDVWLNGMRFAICRAIREIWNQPTNFEDVKAQADWLVSILPIPAHGALTLTMRWPGPRHGSKLPFRQPF